MPDPICTRCGESTGRFPAWIYDWDGKHPYCHKDEQSVSCYTAATQDRTWVAAAFDMQVNL